MIWISPLCGQRNLFKTFMMVAGSQDVCDLVMNGKVVIKDREFAELDEDLILFEGNRQLNDLLRRTVR